MKQHTEEPLTYLLCGKMPHISSSRRQKNKPIPNLKDNPVFDMSAFPPEITTFNKRRPVTSQEKFRTRAVNELSTRKFEFVKESEDVFKRVESNLSLYRDNHKRKCAQIHQDWEERYMTPYNERMKSRLHGNEYESFKEQKTRSMTAMGDRPVLSTLSLDQPVNMPTITLGTKGLEDKVHKYNEHAKKERELTKFITQNSGTYVEPQKLKERNTIDLVAWRLQPETRFYTPDKTIPKGKKLNSQKFKSSVGKELGQFKMDV